MEKGLKIKFRMLLGLIPTFVEVTEKNLVGRAFAPLNILNRINGNRDICDPE